MTKKRTTVDYFPHLVNHKKTIPILEIKYGNDGYAVWFKTLEILGRSEGHYFDCNEPLEWYWLASYMCVTPERLEEIYDTLAELKAISREHWENRIIWCDNFIENIENVYARRSNDPPDPPPVQPRSGTHSPAVGSREAARLSDTGDNESKKTTKPKNLPDPAKAAEQVKSKSAARNGSSAKKITVELVELWNEANGKNLRYTDRKRRQVERRLKTFDIDDIKKAITNRAADQWVKDNEQGSNWDALFDDDESVDSWLNRTPKGSSAGNHQGTTNNALTKSEARKYAETKRMDFNPAMFNIKKINGEERYIPNF